MKVTVGFLPLYVQMYDDKWPHLRERVEAFVSTLVGELEKRPLEVVAVPICRTAPEFGSAVERFRQRDVDAIITYHCAYSPSLESEKALCGAGRKIIVLDTTETWDFGGAAADDEILYNHGIHGVQDMCNLLVRAGVDFVVEAGHYAESTVLDRVCAQARAAALARRMRRARVGRIGGDFAGMGDFMVPAETVAEMGIAVVNYDRDRGARLPAAVTGGEIREEMERHRQRYALTDIPEELHRKTAETCCMIRRWIGEERLTAFTMNFAAVTAALGLPAVPFLAASQAMAEGAGYAGEGDVLTAALAGTLLAAWPDSTFTEMFCPDWKKGIIFLSHMGEMNPALSAGKPVLMEKEFVFTDIGNPLVACGALRPGSAILVNPAPLGGGRFRLILSPVEMMEDGNPAFRGNVRGWLRPGPPLEEYLPAYSRLGGTHHCVLTYGDALAELRAFGGNMGWDVAVL